jgi:DNA sulfur modification protein DndD
MPAVMKILGWKAHGLRCPDHDVSCCDDQGTPSKVTLIQMPNGTGKTTTLALLRAALSGIATTEAWNREIIGEFQKRNGNGNRTGSFEVRLSLNERRATIVMNFDFESGRVTYKTTTGQGQRSGFNPPTEFKRFLNPKFVNFFVFDGELAQRLLDRTKTNAEAAVETLFQVNTFTLLEQKVKDYWTSKTGTQSATEERGRSRRENRVSYLASRLFNIKQQRAALRAKRLELADRLKNQEDAYDLEIKKDEALAADISKASISVEQLKGRVREEAGEVFDAMRDPYALSPTFASAIMSLKSGLDRAKLPGSAAREFFNDIAEEPVCICGRPIDEHIKSAIHERASLYLASDDVLFLNAMKEAIQQAVGASLTEPEKALQSKIAHLGETVTEERSASNALDELRLQAEQGDPAVKTAKDEIDELRAQIAELDHELEKFDSKDQQLNDESTSGVDVLEKRLKDAEQKLAEITNTINMKAKRDVLVQIIGDAHRRARDSITREICNESNKRIMELLPHNRISISRIDRSLVLDGQEGGSVGETLSIAYAFLSTLFNRSEHQLPFVVDSPAGPIDLAVRPKIGELIPRLTDQFIAFTISSERDRFVPKLKLASKANVRFLTVFRKGSKELQQSARAAAEVVESPDGFVVGGEDFFNGFQLDEEVS